MPISDEDKLFAELWKEQSKILLQATSFIPLIQIAIMAAWYTLLKDQQISLAQIVALGGAVVMLLATIYMIRTVQYVGYFRSKIDGLDGLLSGMPRTVWGLTGRFACLSPPILFIPLNLFLACYAVRIAFPKVIP